MDSVVESCWVECVALISRPSAVFVVIADVAERAISDGGKEMVSQNSLDLDSAISPNRNSIHQ